METVLTIEQTEIATSFLNELVNTPSVLTEDLQKTSEFLWSLPNYYGYLPIGCITSFTDATFRFIKMLTEEIDKKCCIFDNVDTPFCLDKKYSVTDQTNTQTLIRLLVAIESIRISTSITIAQKKAPFVQTAKKMLLSVIGRGILIYGSSLPKYKEDETQVENALIKSIITDFIASALPISWTIDESYLLKATVLNLLDAFGICTQNEIRGVLSWIKTRQRILGLSPNDITVNTLDSAISSYEKFNCEERPTVEINLNWRIAFIYKKRFGFIFCKKIRHSQRPGELVYSMEATSPCFKNLQKRRITNGVKVILLEAFETKRSSTYIPVEDSFFYNRVTMMFE